MNVFLKMLSRQLRKNDQAVLTMDQAGWHKAKRLVILGQHHGAVPATLLTGAKSDRAVVKLSPQTLPAQSSVRELRPLARRTGRSVADAHAGTS